MSSVLRDATKKMVQDSDLEPNEAAACITEMMGGAASEAQEAVPFVCCRAMIRHTRRWVLSSWHCKLASKVQR